MSVPSALRRMLAYQRPFRVRVAREGLLAVAPVSVAYVLMTLAVTALWGQHGAAHRAVGACCAWRAADLPHGHLVPLFGSALLVQVWVEAVWTVIAAWLLLGPLEAIVGSWRLLLLGVVGHVVPTVTVDLVWLAGGRADGSLAALDVGTSAVIVTVAAALAVAASSLPLAVALAIGLAGDLAVAPNLASVEHLVATAIGVVAALALRPRRRASAHPGAAGGRRPAAAGRPDGGTPDPDPRRQHARGIPVPPG